jgi:hypothetical protein
MAKVLWVVVGELRKDNTSLVLHIVRTQCERDQALGPLNYRQLMTVLNMYKGLVGRGDLPAGETDRDRRAKRFTNAAAV